MLKKQIVYNLIILNLTSLLQVQKKKLNLKLIHTFSNHQDAIYGLQWSPHKKNLLASGSVDSQIFIWDYLKIGNEIKAEDEKDGPSELLAIINQIQYYHGEHRSQVNDLSWNTNQKNFIASVEQDKNILLLWIIQSQLWIIYNNYGRKMKMIQTLI